MNKLTMHICKCGKRLTRSDCDYLGCQETDGGDDLHLYTCDFCGTTFVNNWYGEDTEEDPMSLAKRHKVDFGEYD